jgi:glyoxylase-like metal-dependent hydrolase (beta-lactamase superfamily II)
MSFKTVLPGLYMLSKSQFNLYLLDDPAGLILIDTGYPGTADFFQAELQKLGRDIHEIRHIILTHLHPDHTGALGEIKQRSGARVAMHPQDASLVRQGQFSRPAKPAPGLLPTILVKLFIHGNSQFPAVEVEEELVDGQFLPYAGGLRVIHAPGHSAGQIVLFWEPRKLLFCADACTNVFGLDFSPIYEDFELGKETLRKLCRLDLDAAVFSHGKPILSGAARAFRRRFLS